jgi:hypothetical protein
MDIVDLMRLEEVTQERTDQTRGNLKAAEDGLFGIE